MPHLLYNSLPNEASPGNLKLFFTVLEIRTSPGCSLEGLMLRLKLQYFGYLMQRVDLLEKTVMLGGIRGRRRRGWQRMRWLDGITDSMYWVNSRSWWWTGRPDVLQFMGSQKVGQDWATEMNWSELTFYFAFLYSLMWLNLLLHPTPTPRQQYSESHRHPRHTHFETTAEGKAF